MKVPNLITFLEQKIAQIKYDENRLFKIRAYLLYALYFDNFSCSWFCN